MTLKSPKQKGDNYERELAAYLNEELFEGREVVTRAPLSGGGRSWEGGAGQADLNGLPGLHFEAKRTERLKIYEAMDQAIRSARGRAAPIVVSRRNRQATGDSLAVMRLSDLCVLLRQVMRRRPLAELPPFPKNCCEHPDIYVVDASGSFRQFCRRCGATNLALEAQ